MNKGSKAKDFLNKVRLQVTYCQALMKELQQVRADNYSLQSSIGGSGGGSGKVNDLSSGAIRAEKYEAKLVGALTTRDRLKSQAIDLIRKLPSDMEKSVLMYRYIIGQEWEEVCVSIHKSWRQTHRLHASALINLDKSLKKMKDGT